MRQQVKAAVDHVGELHVVELAHRGEAAVQLVDIVLASEIDGGPRFGQRVSQSRPSTWAEASCSSTTDLPTAPSPARMVTCRIGMRLRTAHCRSGTGMSSQLLMST